MPFNDTTNKTGLCQEIDDLCDSDSDSYPIAAKARRCNSAMETLIGDIIGADGTWQFDDSNYTNFPEGTIDLIEGQRSYSFTDKFLQIEEVLVLDLNGTYRRIDPIDFKEMSVSVEEMYGTEKALPYAYDKVENSIRLYPLPGAATMTLTAGLKVKFKRTSSPFTASDTTKQPGIASPWHVTIAKMAALPYNNVYHSERVASMKADITDERAKLVKHYARRERDTTKVASMERVNPR